MHLLGLIIFAIGGIMSLIYGILLLITAFRASILWGLGSLLVPVVSLIFVITHWDDAKKPFLLNLLGAGIAALGLVLMAAAARGGDGSY